MSEIQTVVLANRPPNEITPGTFKLKSAPRPTEADLKDGQVLLEILYLSLDPAMRGWIKDVRSYLPPVQIDEVMRGVTISRVLASKSSRVHTGALAVAQTGWREVAILDEKAVEPLDLPSNGRTTDALGVLGPTGLTAYFGLLDVGKVKKGDRVVVSGAAGATGSVVVQIAKLKGAEVVGIAGSDDKVRWLEELGCVGLNYKSPTFREDFKKATPNYIDVFFDNVGGEILDMALNRAKEHATFVICGGISQYNTEKPQGPKNYLNIITMRIRMQGFIVLDYVKEFAAARKELAQWLAEGKIQRKETIRKGGLAGAEQALIDLYKGINTGKLLVEIKPDSESARL